MGPRTCGWIDHRLEKQILPFFLSEHRIKMTFNDIAVPIGKCTSPLLSEKLLADDSCSTSSE